MFEPAASIVPRMSWHSIHDAKVDKSTSTMSYSKTLDTQHASYSTKHHLKKVL